MRFIMGGTRSRSGPEMFVTMLTVASVGLVLLLLVLPTRALAAPADLSINKTGPLRVEPGERFDYVLTVSNESKTATATGVKVTDDLPGGVKFVESEPNVCVPPGGSSVTCTLPPLAAGESRTITLTVRAPLNAGMIENRARANTLGDTGADVVSDRVATTVAPRLVINKLDDPDPVRTDGILAYTLRVQNQSETTAYGVAVTDELPLDLVDFSSVDSRDFDCQYKAGVIQCRGGVLAPGEIGKVEIVVKPEKAGTIKNRADVFVQGIRESLGTDTESTLVKNRGGDTPNGPDGPDGPSGPDVPQGDQCSPVVNLENGDPLEVLSGTDPVQGTFKNFYNDTLPLRIAYATSSEGGSLTITLTRKDNGKTILDEKINGKKRGVLEVDTEAGVTYDVAIVPDNQGYAVDLQIGTGTDEPCTNPEDLEPPGGPDGNNGTNGGGNGANGDNGAEDVIDNTISDNPLPNTGGPSLLGLAAVALGVAISASVVTVRRRDR